MVSYGSPTSTANFLTPTLSYAECIICDTNWIYHGVLIPLVILPMTPVYLLIVRWPRSMGLLATLDQRRNHEPQTL
jgi:hypothetical protein